MTIPIHEMSATQMKAAFASQQFSRVEAVEALIRRADEVNPKINALVHRFNERALEEARAADRAPKSERERLPLDGVPIVVSDWYAIEGVPQTQGVRAFQDVVSAQDDIVVQRIREAGGIIIGKAPIPEFALRWNLVSELYGETLNPRDLSCSAGGSGGGVAAAVASGMAPIGFHADAGGSLRVPAAYCGVYAYRPSPNAVIPLTAPSTLSFIVESVTSLGAHTRTIEDAWLATKAVAGEHISVPATSPSRLPDDFFSERRPRVARVIEQTGALVDADVVDQVNRTAALLAEQGYEVVDVAPEDASRLPELWLELLGTEVCNSFLPPFRDQIGKSAVQHMDALFSQGDLGNDVGRLLRATSELRDTQRRLSEWMSEYELILAPVTGMSRPPIDYDYWLSDEDTRVLFDQMRNVVMVNSMGLPAVALPNGVQLIARKYHDEDAVMAASSIASSLGSVSVATP